MPNYRCSNTEFSVAALSEILFEHFALAENTQFVVAYSGGCDSQVLLHGLVSLRNQSNIEVMAAHFEHGLQAQSTPWAQQCESWCNEFDTRFVSIRRIVDDGRGQSIEANARDARYRWLDEISQPQQVVVSAHHADDQAETFLLRLFQGKEMAQLGGIAPARPLVHGSSTTLIRPLLRFSRAQLVGYARRKKLQWIEDPMNHDLRFYRNYIRHAVMPVIGQRAPNVVNALNRVADSCRQIAEREQSVLSAWYARCSCAQSRSVFCLTNPLDLQQYIKPGDLKHDNLPQEDGKHQLIGLIRYWIHNAGYASPSNGQLATLCQQIVAQPVAQASIAFNGLVTRYYHHHLYLTRRMPCRASLSRSSLSRSWDMRTINITEYGITVKMVNVASGGLDRYAVQGKKLHLVWRKKASAGERVRLPNRSHRSALKKLFQANHVPPWERDYLPFLTADDEIVWVHGIGAMGQYADADATDSENVRVCPQFSLIDKS